MSWIGLGYKNYFFTRQKFELGFVLIVMEK